VSSALAELAAEQERRAAALLADRLEGGATARGIGGDRGEQVAQLLRARRIEGAIGPLAEPGDLLEGAAGDGIAALVKEKDRDAEQPELAGAMAERIGILLHRIADEDQGIDLSLPRRLDRVVEHALDLRLAPGAEHSAHRAMQLGALGVPPAGLAFAKAAIEDELHLEAAERCRRLEHP